MRSAIPIVCALLLACTAQAPPAQVGSTSACALREFEGDRFTVCSVARGKVEVRTSDAAGYPYRSFVALEAALARRAERVAFAMNAGMFDEDGRAIGLLIEDGKQLHAINLRKGGGNFHLMPNGVFLVRRNGSAEIMTSPQFKPAADIAFATQSGPMLVIDGKVHPRFEINGTSRHVRNGVGIAPDGTPIFAISNDQVSFGKLARFFRDELKTRDALYFDGSVSSLWDPANNRRDAHVLLGPMVVVFRPSGSAPGREAPARS